MATLIGVSIADISKLPGVSDVKPALAKGKFAQALKLEAEGKHAEAAVKLEEAASIAE